MRALFKTALQNKGNRWLLGLIVLSMCGATLASQAEIFAIGLITQKGPDFFELFGNTSVTFPEVEQKWSTIAGNLDAPITKEAAAHYLVSQKPGDIILRAFVFIDQTFQIRKNLSHLALFLLTVALFKAITMFIHRYTTKLASIRISSELRQRFFEHMQTLPMTFYQKHNMGSLSSRVVGDAALVAEALNACLVNYIETPFILITTLILCFLTSWQLTLLVFFGLPLIVFPIVFLSKGVKRLAKQIQGIQEKFAAVLIDFIGGIQTVKIFGMEAFSLEKYRQQNVHMASLEKRSARYDLSARPIVHTVAMAFLSLAMIYGLYVLHMQVAEVLFYCGMLYLFYEPIKKFAEENSRIQRGIAAADRTMEVLAVKPEVADFPGAHSLASFNHDIVFDNVWFKYEDDWILKGLSFQIKKGEKAAIVGPTGAGKSTIAQLLPRLYDIQEGEIRIDGKPLTAYTQSSIRQQIAFVPQRPFLFMDAVSHNIAYGQPFTKEQIQSAAEKAHATEFVEHLPHGFDTIIAEGGKNLSGGQQQRLAIARALVKNAPILIMDEATSSLDAVSENHIKQALHELKGDMTQILIAHRLSTIEDADKIIYLDKGIKIAEGTKDELLEICPPFKRMWELLHQET